MWTSGCSVVWWWKVCIVLSLTSAAVEKGATLLLKPEPSLDLPVDPLRKTHESRQFSPPYTSPKPMEEFADQVEL